MAGAADEPQAKANTFNSAVATLRRMLDAAAFARCTAALSPETAQLVAKPALPMVWLPTRQFAELLETAARVGFAGDESRIEELARQSIAGDMRTVYRVFIRVLSPQFVMQRASRLWGTYTRNNGTMHAVAAGPRAAEVHYEGLSAAIVSPVYWSWQRGSLRAVGETTGIENIRIETVRGGGRARECVVRVTWA